MTEFDAVYYDGKTSARWPVRVRGAADGLQVEGEGFDFTVPLRDVEVDAPLTGSERALHLPGEALLQTADHAAVEALFPQRHPLQEFVHALERRWPWALAGAAFLALLSWWLVVDGLPLGAKFAAGFVPHEAEAKLGSQVLGALDLQFCKPSSLDAARQEALRARLAALTAGLDDGYTYRLELRDCPALGPNAFALPGGSVVFTDSLAKLARNDDQVSAVLAHEIGHVRHRHALRAMLQAAGLAALSAAVLGDVVSITSLAVSVPTAILQRGYSRGFEAQADEYAFARLKAVGISPEAFADVMVLLEKSAGAKAEPGGHALDYLSTHPATASRIERARQAARQ